MIEDKATIIGETMIPNNDLWKTIADIGPIINVVAAQATIGCHQGYNTNPIANNK